MDLSWLLLEDQAIDRVPRLAQIGYWHLWVLHGLGWTFIGLARIQNREFSDRDD